jgi:hypothetical protein
LKDEEYPELYRESSACAGCNQKKHFKLLKIRISLLISYALLGAVAWSKLTEFSVFPLLIITVVLSLALLLTIILDKGNFDKLWYCSRAIAEMVKSESWLFMMRAKPYDQAGSEKTTESNFVDFLKDIVNDIARSQPNVIPQLAQYEGEAIEVVTERMREIRKSDVKQRLKIYTENRIREQKNWYSKKVKSNLSQESHFSILMWIFQAFTVIFALLSVLNPNLPFNLIGIATTTATAILLWLNMKNYRELSQSYGFVARELTFFAGKTVNVSSEEELAELVLNVEGIMNQEHAMWNAKRLSIIKNPVKV